jgi:hypothetical protein
VKRCLRSVGSGEKDSPHRSKTNSVVNEQESSITVAYERDRASGGIQAFPNIGSLIITKDSHDGGKEKCLLPQLGAPI